MLQDTPNITKYHNRSEILNLEYNLKRLLIVALNRHNKRKEVASALGVTICCVRGMMQRYKIKKVEGVYYIGKNKFG